jgi:NDP-sugar pyrophosphorylase family protein
MKAMVLAAGLGTRLRPLTNDRPKALVEIAGRTLLEITLTRLASFGIQDIIINAHHFADKLVDHLQARNHFSLHVEISREEVLLDTGGGLKKAAHFFLESEQPFMVHNVDVISDIDLGRMLRFHLDQQALATIAVQDRKTSRYLLFDDNGQLCGRRVGDEKPELVGRGTSGQSLAFCGIHVISPLLLRRMTEEGAFSIITSYLRLAGTGERILCFPADEYSWRDLGTPEKVAQAEADLRKGKLRW